MEDGMIAARCRSGINSPENVQPARHGRTLQAKKVPENFA